MSLLQKRRNTYKKGKNQWKIKEKSMKTILKYFRFRKFCSKIDHPFWGNHRNIRQNWGFSPRFWVFLHDIRCLLASYWGYLPKKRSLYLNIHWSRLFHQKSRLFLNSKALLWVYSQSLMIRRCTEGKNVKKYGFFNDFYLVHYVWILNLVYFFEFYFFFFCVFF